MLPRELSDKAKAVEKAMEDFKDAMIAWMNANKGVTVAPTPGGA
jgi:hypothetical protein